MTPEKFRQWIVILFAVSILTVWVGMGLKLSLFKKHGVAWQKTEMERQMPTRRARPERTRKPTRRPAQPAPSTEQAK